MGVVTGTLINGNYVFFDLEAIKTLCFDFDKNIVTVEMIDMTCYNCKIDSLYLNYKGIALSDFGIIDNE